MFDEMSTLVKRLDAPECDYLTEVLESEQLMLLRDRMRRLVLLTFQRCRDFRSKFEAYSYMWMVRAMVGLSSPTAHYRVLSVRRRRLKTTWPSFLRKPRRCRIQHRPLLPPLPPIPEPLQQAAHPLVPWGTA
jgi:hypothetical protein